MSDSIRRTETTYVDEKTGSARCTVQWLQENLNRQGAVTHPISHNNKLTFFICGADGFKDIAEQIAKAVDTIDIIFWGFDPGIELQRTGSRWPRGDTYGDLLVAAGKRGVQVRLLVWYDPTAKGPAHPYNMPGYGHDTDSWYAGPLKADEIDSKKSVAMLKAHMAETVPSTARRKLTPVRAGLLPKRDEEIPLCARRQYCSYWYRAAFNGEFKGIAIKTRKGSSSDIADNLSRATKGQRDGATPSGPERLVMLHGGSHHQKPILIDYDYNDGEKAVGYVMGLNSVTDYWDTAEHKLEDPLREQGGEKETKECIQQVKDAGFKTFKPLRDYACRIDRGGTLIALYKNFTAAWEGDSYSKVKAQRAKPMMDVRDWENGPAVLRRKPASGDCTAQIVRTSAEDRDISNRDSYFTATDNATMGAGYIYIENQYFQYEEWSRRLLETRKKSCALYNKACGAAGKTLRDLPPMHVFIVTPTPERAQMIPRTYDSLATLGLHGGLEKQQEMIDRVNKTPKQGPYVTTPKSMPAANNELTVVEHANSIDKPDMARLERDYGIRACVTMLYACGKDGGRWRYREIYIHSKLMIVDDLFLTLGSANLNHRSMAVDSEINISVLDPVHAKKLRKRVWSQLTGKTAMGGEGSKKEMAVTFKSWVRLMEMNKAKVLADSKKIEEKKLIGYILQLEDNRSSIIRLG
ncbi:phospholipase D-like domain-containing protein [Pseudoduganella umbonata]|uniref:Phosphatidylserine/phosphatidylglycerophosphate/ cardiolipin synthase-like enzyme n=1 Tax=Pseudoduganella umbonata TaxID=864828 RepID=A0A4P8HW55_9BURK|nr:phospholipase D-like domain-containing protein [Pseudoduganella umbonata]MBB3223026.1 phosphatidylserine/phosphatidylglycerophosphate/cardiolipin synthase-like enzyme [Pseudoduganella umbonata]QCP13132.1 phospholipase [Pseudoduganella umbonata]